MRLRRRWLPALLVGLAVIGCDLPVRVGIEHTRAAPRVTPASAVPPAPVVFRSRPAGGAGPAAASAVPVAGRPAEQPPAPPAAASPGPHPIRPVARVVTHPGVPQPAGRDDVVGVRLEAATPTGRQFVTFGQVFAPGQVPVGSSVVAHAAEGEVPTQLDVKTTHPDGSVRIGVVTLHASAPADIILRRIGPRPPGRLVNLGDLQGRYDARVRLTVQGTTEPLRHDFDLAGLLEQALLAGRVSFWLHGPLVSEGRIEAPVTGAMRLVADIRAYANGSVRTDIQFNNDIAMQPAGGALVYDVAIVADGKPVLQEQEVRHFQYQTWHREVWSGQPASINVVRDSAALARAGAIQNYDLSTGVDAEVIARLAAALSKPDFGILGAGGLTRYMPTTGGRPEIGATTQANTIWLMTQHPDAERYALAQADAAGSIPWHFHDRATGTALSPERYPRLWIDDRGGRWGTVALTQAPDAAAGWTPDNAHQPDLSYVPYILTGSRYRYDQMEAQAIYAILATSPDYRGEQRAIVVNNVAQVRGRAWAFRAVEQAAFVAPDDAPLRPFFRSAVRNCIDYLQAETRWRTIGEVHGVFGSGPGVYPNGGGTAPWQQDFLANALAMSAMRGVAGARELVAWMTNFVAGRFTSADKGFRPNNGTAFGLVLYARDPLDPYLTWREVEAANIARSLAQDSDKLAGTLAGTAQIARGSLASVVTVTDLPQARQALDWVNTTLPGVSARDFRRDPTWNIIPLAGVASTRP